MLVRAARRKTQPQSIRNVLSCEQLQLPWLCPSYNTTQRIRRRWISIDNGAVGSGLRQRRNSKDASNMPSRRALATSVSYGHDDIPFDSIGLMSSPSSRRTQAPYGGMGGISDLKPFDPESALYFNDTLSTSPVRFRMRKDGTGGDVYDMESVFRACLMVGRVERAGVILRRLAKGSADLDPGKMLELHNSYLRSSAEQAVLNPSESTSQDIHKWFELDFIKAGYLPNAETIGYMVKASLQSPGSRRQRLVRRYMDMVTEDTAYKVLCNVTANILTAQEVNQVVHICPEYNMAEQIMEVPEEDIIETESLDSATIQQNVSPLVRPTLQKGLGLKSLKNTLSLFTSSPERGFKMSDYTEEQRRDIQTRLEEDAITAAIGRWREESAHLNKMGLNTTLQTKSLGARMWKWQVSLKDYLKEELLKVDASEAAEHKTEADQERCQYGPFLRLLPADKLAAVTILTVMTTMGAQGMDRGLKLSTAITAIARGVEDECAFSILDTNTKNGVWPREKDGDQSRFTTEELLKKVARFRHPGQATRIMSSLFAEDDARKAQLPKDWPIAMRARVGAYLMAALIETAQVPVSIEHPENGSKVTQMQTAFMHSHKYQFGKKIGVVIANKALVAQMKREPVHSLLAKHLPMLVKPEPWTQFNKGGFLTRSSKMMRIKLGDKDQRHYAEAAIGQGSMEQTFKALDVLGKTSWQINQPVFDVMLEAWNSGEAIASMPAESPVFDMPPEPESTQDPTKRRRWVRDVKVIENTKSGLHSQRCFQNFQLEIARALRNETFYFPHNVDFRGRAYPIPPYLNHIGADHCRGLLRFGKGKELGAEGFRWLKIHFSNVYGFDKASLSEREKFTDNNMDNIYDSVKAPLTGKRWWLTAEDPWQCLAACFEIQSAIESGNPATFVSHLPVHQDGTCNGLQHYAALGGDTWGAKQVNLEPGDRPADVYTAVADLVKSSIKDDISMGNKFAIALENKITRKTVKQTVMTNVYGVTFIGAKAQVRKQLVARGDIPDTEEINPGKLSGYIAGKIFDSLSTMFKGAHDIQHWLGECAGRISTCLTKEQLDRLESDWPLLAKPNAKTGKRDRTMLEEIMQFKSSVIWTTPLHMPVVQPYRKHKPRKIDTHLQMITLAEPQYSSPVSKKKQLQGFPPNFIHSLDATHMLLSALECDKLGLSFASVHDSFWTHASDIPKMNTVLRDSFIRIHSENVMGRLAAEFAARYRGCLYWAKLRKDSPVYEKIAAWRKENPASKSKWRLSNMPKNSGALSRVEELMLERERARLLGSSDPDEIAKGKAMVTPGSIFEANAAQQDLASDTDIPVLGEISTVEAHHSTEDAAGAQEHSDITSLTDAIAVDGAHQENDVLDGLPEMEKTDTRTRFERELAKKYVSEGTSYLWLPLTFSPVPKRGEFDVSRLKNSEYFFS